MRLWPTRKQWSSWSLPSRASFVGLILSAVGIVVGLVPPRESDNGQERVVRQLTELQKQLSAMNSGVQRIETAIGSPLPRKPLAPVPLGEQPNECERTEINLHPRLTSGRFSELTFAPKSTLGGNIHIAKDHKRTFCFFYKPEEVIKYLEKLPDEALETQTVPPLHSLHLTYDHDADAGSRYSFIIPDRAHEENGDVNWMPTKEQAGTTQYFIIMANLPTTLSVTYNKDQKTSSPVFLFPHFAKVIRVHVSPYKVDAVFHFVAVPRAKSTFRTASVDLAITNLVHFDIRLQALTVSARRDVIEFLEHQPKGVLNTSTIKLGTTIRWRHDRKLSLLIVPEGAAVADNEVTWTAQSHHIGTVQYFVLNDTKNINVSAEKLGPRKLTPGPAFPGIFSVLAVRVEP